MLKFGLSSLSPQFARNKSEVLTILIGLIVGLAITSCSSSKTPSAAYLPPELEKVARREAMEYPTTSGLEDVRLDTVTELIISDIRHPALGSVDKEMWCLTTVVRGTLEGASHEVSMQWFGIKREGEDWMLIPRHIVAYPAFWDDACDEAERLDR